MPENCWKIECWIEMFLIAHNPMKENVCLQSKFTKPFDVCWNNFMPTSHFLFYACSWILIVTTGTFQLICITNFAIIERACWGTNMSFIPEINFTTYCVTTHLWWLWKGLVTDAYCLQKLYFQIHERIFFAGLKLNILLVFFWVFFPSVLVCSCMYIHASAALV